MIAATQASIATTQAIEALEGASTQMSSAATLPSALPQLPPVGKGTMIIFTPRFIIIQKDGKRLIVPRPQYDDDDNTNQ
jgi:hypothetical protein